MLSIARIKDSRVENAWRDAEEYIHQTGGKAISRSFMLCKSAHAPTWHAHSAGRHNDLVAAAALIVLGATGINVVSPMALHDIGKVSDFVRYWQEGESCSDFQQYNGHEERSAQIAIAHGLNEESQFVIRYHAMAYRCLRNPEQIFEKCGGDKDLLIKLILAFACDAYGKGWTKAQKKQRPQIAFLIYNLCNQHGLPPVVRETAVLLTLDGQR